MQTNPAPMSVTEYLRAQRERNLSELFDFLRIPSVSARSEREPEVRRAATWLADQMREAGLTTVDVLETEGHPIVLGEWRDAPAGAPTVVIYGHYDVQPEEPLDEWDSAPFEPALRDGRIYARGSVDDKGQLYLHLKAVQAHLATGGTLPVNVVFVVEGEEEVGSAHLETFLTENAERLRCDAVLISDTSMIAPGQPTITVGLRGMAYMEVHVQGPRSDLHSGMYGGAVVNPAVALAKIIAQLHDERGRVTVPGFYDRVVELSPEERRRVAELPFEEETLREEVGAPKLGGEAGYSALERLGTRPTLDVNGMLSGYTAEGAKTVLPARAMAKISMRLVPDQDWEEIARRFAEYVPTLAPEGVTVEVRTLHGGTPWYEEPKGPIFEAAARALEACFGRAPVFLRDGGSIPIVESFRRRLDVPSVLIGFGLPGENAHAPNEWMSLENFHVGTEAIARLYDELRDGAAR